MWNYSAETIKERRSALSAVRNWFRWMARHQVALHKGRKDRLVPIGARALAWTASSSARILSQELCERFQSGRADVVLNPLSINSGRPFVQPECQQKLVDNLVTTT